MPGQSKAYLKRLRKKHGLGEFAGRKRGGGSKKRRAKKRRLSGFRM